MENFDLRNHATSVGSYSNFNPQILQKGLGNTIQNSAKALYLLPFDKLIFNFWLIDSYDKEEDQVPIDDKREEQQQEEEEESGVDIEEGAFIDLEIQEDGLAEVVRPDNPWKKNA